MEQFGDLIMQLKDFIHPPELSANTYSRPLPPSVHITKEIKVSPTHTGPYAGAIDFCVPLSTPVLAAREGKVTAVVDSYEDSGPTPDFARYYNHIQIIHAKGEISEYGHLAQGSSAVKVGDIVEEGKKIAVTGSSGYMTEPHLHFLVYKLTPGEKYAFQGLRPKFK